MIVPEDAIILGETPVAEVNGHRVGSGNYYTRSDAKGVKRKSIMIAIWRSGEKDAKADVREIFEYDTFDIGGKKFKLVMVDEGKAGETGKAYIVPVK